jgi:hypothetical protein
METYIANLQNVIPSTKEQLVDWSKQFLNELDNGNITGLEAKKMLVLMQKFIDNVKEDVDSAALNEASKYGAKQFEHDGLKHEIREVGTRYDFSNCGDTEYNEYFSAKKEAETKLKERESFLKSLPKPVEIHIGEGEVITVTPPTKYSKTAVVSTIL